MNTRFNMYTSTPDKHVLSQQMRLSNGPPFTSPILPKRPQQHWTAKFTCAPPHAAACAGCLLLTILILGYLTSPERDLEAEKHVHNGAWELRCSRKQGPAQHHHQQQVTPKRKGSKAGSSSSSSGMLKQDQGASSIWRRPVLLLLGDSLTELGEDADGGWTSKLATAYRRKADVLNRGFSGYNTLTTLLGLCEVTDGLSRHQVALATVWLGANDAALTGRRDEVAHVPVGAYKSNLINITQQLQEAGVQQVVLMTPPPVFDDAEGQREAKPPRTFNMTSQYAAAAREVAGKVSVLLLDIWELFVAQQGWQQQLLAADGLHLSKQGQQAVYQGLMKLLEKELPQLLPASLPWHHPNWRSLYDDPQQHFAAEQAAFREEFGDAACLDDSVN